MKNQYPGARLISCGAGVVDLEIDGFYIGRFNSRRSALVYLSQNFPPLGDSVSPASGGELAALDRMLRGAYAERGV